MTIDRTTLKALVEKGSDEDLLREMMAYVANRMMVRKEPRRKSIALKLTHDIEGSATSSSSCLRRWSYR
jgi:hypothetical protein